MRPGASAVETRWNQRPQVIAHGHAHSIDAAHTQDLDIHTLLTHTHTRKSQRHKKKPSHTRLGRGETKATQHRHTLDMAEHVPARSQHMDTPTAIDHHQHVPTLPALRPTRRRTRHKPFSRHEVKQTKAAQHRQQIGHG